MFYVGVAGVGGLNARVSTPVVFSAFSLTQKVRLFHIEGLQSEIPEKTVNFLSAVSVLLWNELLRAPVILSKSLNRGPR